MIKQERRRLHCGSCAKLGWALAIEGRRGHYSCKVCSSEIKLWEALNEARSSRLKRRTRKAKELGTYVSVSEKKEKREERSREIDKRYVWWVHGWRCIVPGCQTPWPVHAHHVGRRSQGGSDRSCIPLCPQHHLGDLHTKYGPRLCQEKWQVDFEQIIDALNHNYEVGKNGPQHWHIEAYSEAKIYPAT